MIKESILQENITLLNIYVLNNRTSKYMKPKHRIAWRNRQMYHLKDFNIPLSITARTSRQIH